MEMVYKMARDLIKKHDGDWQAAAEEGVGLCRSDPTLWKEFSQPLLVRAFLSIIENEGRDMRSSLLKVTVPTLPKGTSGEELNKGSLQAQSTAIKSMLNEFWLNRCKKFLGEATREDLQEEINMRLLLSKGVDLGRVFLQKVYNELGPKQKVRARFSDTDLERLKKLSMAEMDKKWNGQFINQELTT